MMSCIMLSQTCQKWDQL